MLQHINDHAAEMGWPPSEEMLVHKAVANHPNAPPEMLQRLLQYPAPQVARAAADNPNLPAATLAMWQLTR